MKTITNPDVVPKPCQENWLEMNPYERSRFCTLCQKNIFDFTNENSEFTENSCLRYSTLQKDKKKKSTILNVISKLLIRQK